MKKKLDDFFKITERGSSISTELIGGATTFATMAYILAYMTWSMSAIPGINLTGVLICTALVTAAACLAMGLYSNTPICLAPVLVIPGLIAGWVADGTATYAQAFGIVAISGIVFILVSLFNLRELFARCLPKNLKIGLAADRPCRYEFLRSLCSNRIRTYLWRLSCKEHDPWCDRYRNLLCTYLCKVQYQWT